MERTRTAAATRASTRAWGVVAIVAFALALRLALFLAVGAWDPERLDRRIFVGDAREYHRLAVNLVEQGVYSSKREAPFEPNTFRVPLYPWYLAFFYRLFGPLPWVAILPQLAIGALTCGVIWRAGTILFGPRAGVAAGTIYAADYCAILFSNRLYSDTLFTFLVALVVLALARYGMDRRARFLAGAGALLGLATLCRPVSLYCVIAIGPVLWMANARSQTRADGERGSEARRDADRGAIEPPAATRGAPADTARGPVARGTVAPGRGRVVSLLAAWAIVTAAYLAVLAPWMLRNLAVAGRPFVTSMQASLDSWYLPRMSGAPLSGVPRETVARLSGPARLIGDLRSYGRGFVRYFTVLGSGEYPLILGVRYQRHDFVALREASLAAWIGATLRHRASPLERTIVIGIVVWLLALYGAAARGVWVALRDGQRFAAALLLVTIGYFMVATGPISREVRYRLPALPAIVLLAGLGVTAARTGAAAHSSRSSPAPSSRSAA